VQSPAVLEGGVIRLEPLNVAHVPGLAAAASGERTSFHYTWVPDGLAEASAYVQFALQQAADGQATPYAVVLTSNGEVVGSTRLLDFVRFDAGARYPQAAEIGYTWYAPSVQRTAVNTAAKLALLREAFDVWAALRVSLKTDARNARSRAAIERLGAEFEGVRRAHMSASDGGVRDTAYYSIVRAEWPVVKTRLETRRPGRPGARSARV
jgi:RimJ/RimL family protein N-acetyltransferase